VLAEVVTESQETHLADEPKYRAIAAALADKIQSGELTAGERLPSDADLGAEYTASRNTVRQAIQFLLTRGVVEKQPSGATLVRKKIDPFRTVVSAETGFGGVEGAAYASDVEASNRRPAVTKPRVEIQEAPAAIADALGVSEGSAVVVRHQERIIDDELWSMQTSYYPMSFVEQGATKLLAVEDLKEGTRHYLAKAIGVQEIGSRDTMTVRAPTPGEADRFGLPEDGRIAVFETRQMGVDPGKKPVRVTITIYPSDRNTFSMETGRLAEQSSEGNS
jgi:GntR family transcriptional regulator